MKRILTLGFIALLGTVPEVKADERLFTYSYETSVLPEDGVEFEQWITNESGVEEGDFSAFEFRSELEYGVTDRWQTAFYLNFDAVRSEGIPDEEDEDGMDFKGISWENIYQILNPNLDPVGLAAYVEYTSDGLDHELETKLLVSKPVTDEVTLVANAIYEAEWEKEHGEFEKEAVFEATAGASYKLSQKWSAGVEVRNKSAYPDGLDLSGQEFNTWSVGPNVHYGSSTWWATLTVLPQVWGNGDGSNGNRQLVHEESMEVRLIFGRNL